MVQQRNIALAIVLSIVTCGIYGIYWQITLVNEVNTVSQRQDTSGGMVFLLSLITCGIYYYFWLYKAGEKVDEAWGRRGINNPSNRSLTYLLLAIFGLSIVSISLIQNEVNQLVA